jgi:hypothetical protein
MYIIELPLLLLGLYFLIKKYQLKTQIFIIASLICSVLPSGFASGKTFAIRDLVMIPFLSMITGIGIYTLFDHKIFSKFKYSTVGVVSLIYIFLISSYLYQYYTRYSIYGAEAYMNDKKQLAIFISQNKTKYDKVYVATGEKIFLAQYGIFGQINPTLIQKAWQEDKSIVENVNFNFSCIADKNGKFIDKLPEKSLYIVPASCNQSVAPSIQIKNLETGETIWKIYEI